MVFQLQVEGLRPRFAKRRRYPLNLNLIRLIPYLEQWFSVITSATFPCLRRVSWLALRRLSLLGLYGLPVDNSNSRRGIRFFFYFFGYRIHYRYAALFVCIAEVAPRNVLV